MEQYNGDATGGAALRALLDDFQAIGLGLGLGLATARVRVRARVRALFLCPERGRSTTSRALYPNPNQVEYATRHPHLRPQLAQAQARGG